MGVTLSYNFNFVLYLLFAGLFTEHVFSQGSQQAMPAADSPNLILIIADDMAWDDCGACGHPNIQTPNIDKLASEGMLFQQAFLTTSSCSPSRSSIITGTWPHQTDAEQLHWPLPADKITFVEKLKEAGYWVAQAGKWHLGDHVKGRFDMLAEESLPFLEEHYGELPKPDGSGSHLWIPLMESLPENQPFFLWLAASDPHRTYQEGIIENPHTTDDVILPPYVPDTEEVRKDYALYYDEITRFDQYIGKVVEHLEQNGISENTLILVISDNGRPFPRDKTTMYDSGIKTPWIIKWPQGIQAGSKSSSLVSSVDIANTFLALAGVNPLEHSPGVDFSPVFAEPETSVRNYIYAQAHWHDHENFVRAVRDGRFKYIRTFFNDLPLTPPADALNGGTFNEIRRLLKNDTLDEWLYTLYFEPRPREEFYDLENDPFELNNLAEDPAFLEEMKKFKQKLLEFMATYNDGVPRLRTPDEFHRVSGARLPNNQLPRPAKHQFFGNCECIYRPAPDF